MSYIFLVKDQLATFLCSLQDLLAAKHDVTKENLPPKIEILMNKGLAEEVAREKLEISPNFKVEEYGLQLRFYQEDRVIGIKGYCLKILKVLIVPVMLGGGRYVFRLPHLEKMK